MALKFWPLVHFTHNQDVGRIVQGLKHWSCVHFSLHWHFVPCSFYMALNFRSLVNFLLNWIFDPLFTLYVTKILTTCSFCIGPRFHSVVPFICDQNFSSMLIYMEPKFWSHLWCNLTYMWSKFWTFESHVKNRHNWKLNVCKLNLTPMKSKLHALKNVWTYNGSLFNYLYFSKVKCPTINIC
jgi:hypothetical protein